tara:strand:- start:16 stop:372 length:357 start_codon:yes stop_codon:yes gene_type:complete
MNGLSSIGGWELLLISVIAIFVLGPERMIRYAFHAGRIVNKFSSYWKAGVDEFRKELSRIDDEAHHSLDKIGQIHTFRDIQELVDGSSIDATKDGSEFASEDSESSQANSYGAWHSSE